MEAMAQACASRADVSAESLRKPFAHTLFCAAACRGCGSLIAKPTREPEGFLLSSGLKDNRHAVEANEAAGAPLPFAGILRDKFIDAIAHGLAE